MSYYMNDRVQCANTPMTVLSRFPRHQTRHPSSRPCGPTDAKWAPSHNCRLTTKNFFAASASYPHSLVFTPEIASLPSAPRKDATH